MLYVGDIHGNVDKYLELIEEYDQSIQVGDFGFGFLNSEETQKVENLNGSGHFFIRGNHDDPDLAEKSPQFLQSGYHENLDLFVVNGAWSVDFLFRTPGLNWWPKEEHTTEEFMAIEKEYRKVKPATVISHDCPTFIMDVGFRYSFIRETITGKWLHMMFNEHEPDLWVFGHHHKSLDLTYNKTRFVCLAEYEARKL